jgi:hypothetical protein
MMRLFFQLSHKFLLAGLLFFFTLHPLVPQMQLSDQDCIKTNRSFLPGERVNYVVSYNWFVFYTDVGVSSFQVTRDTKYGKAVLHLAASGVTLPAWDRFFPVRDLYQSWVDPETVLPLYFSRMVREGNYKKDVTYRFKHDKGQVFSEYESSRKPFYRDTIGIVPCTYDIVSVIYHLRNLDLDEKSPGDTIGFRIMLDNELTDIYIRFLGREEKSVRRVGTFKTIKFSAKLVEGSVFSGGEDMFIWVSDDLNKMPVYIETPIRVGNVRVRVSDWQGLRHPLTSKIK